MIYKDLSGAVSIELNTKAASTVVLLEAYYYIKKELEEREAREKAAARGELEHESPNN